uniref:Glypican-6 n=1 Tax=Macrostomum lignano TaxID=282301 RepID=A0A1I8IZY5_9PLAT
METALENRAKTDMYQDLYQHLVPQSTSLASVLTSFQSLALQMVNNSYTKLDTSFKSIYGYSYIENKQPFLQFFEGLRAYLSGGPDTVAGVAKALFESISSRVYVLVMTNYDIDEAYLTCVRSRLDQLKPLGNMPERISQELIRAFVPARRFLAGLAALQDAVQMSPATPLPAQCQKSQLRSRYCAWCDGITNLQPCFELCSASMADCLTQLDSLAEPFDQLLDELVKLSNKIRGPNNLYQVLENLGLRISAGIMDMQERKDHIQTEVAKLCGPPKLKANGSPSIVPPPLPRPGRGRRRRRRASMFGWNYRNSDDAPGPSSQAQERLDELALTAKRSLPASRSLFRPSSLAKRFCKADPAPPGRCWNGTDSAAGYTAPASTVASPVEPPTLAVSQRVANLRAAHRLLAELPKSESFAGFVEQPLDPTLRGLLNKRARFRPQPDRRFAYRRRYWWRRPRFRQRRRSSARAGGPSASPAAGGFPRRLSTLPPLTRPPPAGVVDSWRPLPPIRPRPDTAGSGDAAATGAACNPLATAAACDPLATAAACDPLATAAACDPLATAAAPQPPVVDGSSTVAPLPWRPQPVNPGLGSGDEERPPPPRPGSSSSSTSGPLVPGGVSSGDGEPTGPPPPPRPVPSGWPWPPIVDVGGGETSGDGELPPPVAPPQPPSPPTESWWTPRPPVQPQPPRKPATRWPPQPPRQPPRQPPTRWPPVIPGPPPGEPDDQGGAERGRGEGSIHGPMKMTSAKRACPPGSPACPACRPLAASAGTLLLLAGLQRLLMLLR